MAKKKKKTKKKNSSKYLDLSAFKDGYDFGDVTKTIVGSAKKTSKTLQKNAKKAANNKTTNKNTRLSTQIGYKPTSQKKNNTKTDFLSFLDSKSSKSAVSNILTGGKDERTWFNKGLFEDGYDFGDVTKTLLGTDKDLRVNAGKGIGRIGEGLVDTVAYGVGGVAKAFGNDKFADKTKQFIARDLVEEGRIGEKIGRSMGGTGLVFDAFEGLLNKGKTQEISVLGDKSDSLVQSAGQLGGTIGLQAVGVPWWVTTGVTGFGSGTQEAFQNDATYGEAGVYGAISAGTEVAFEKIGGIKFGGKALDTGLKKQLSKAVSNKVARNLVKFGIDAGAEGTEEVLTEITQNIGRGLTFEDEKTMQELLTSEEAMDQYIEAFIGGAVMGGGFNAGKLVQSHKTGRDYDTGLTDNEQKVVNSEIEARTTEKQKKAAVESEIDKVIAERTKHLGTLDEKAKKNVREEIQAKLDNGELDFTTAKLTKKERTEIEKQVEEDLKAGYIDIGTIENTLAGEKTSRINELRDLLSKTTKDTEKSAIETELRQLEGARAEEMKGLLGKDNFLQESYRQEALKGESFSRETTDKDSDITKELIESAKFAGMNNTRRMHELFDYTNKIANDTKTKYGFVNNEQLKQLGHEVEGKTINGLVRVTEDGSAKILINVDSNKAINTIIGHETTHLLEGTAEHKKLVDIVKEYATTKGDYDARLKEFENLYQGVNADIENEITADLVGDYLFTDEQFITNLSVKEPNIFQKVYDYIKHVYKMATAGSSEARQLEQVKRRFDKAYKQMSKTVTQETKTNSLTEADSNTKVSISDSNGRKLSEKQREYFKDSKVRDENGNLMTVYHGTANGGDFTVFDGNKLSNMSRLSQIGQGFYFTNDKNEAKAYMSNVDIYGKQSKGSAPNLMEAYLDIKNPFYINRDSLNLDDVKATLSESDYEWMITNGIPHELQNKVINGEKYTKAEISAMSREDKISLYVDWQAQNGTKNVLSNMTKFFKSGEQGKLLEAMKKHLGFDGVIEEFADGKMQYSVFSSEQVKRVDNTKPTSNPDIRYSISDKDYMSAVEKGDTETARRMVDDAAKNAGYTRTMFHETDAENIHVFDMSRGTHGANDFETPHGIFTKSSSKNIGLGSRQMKLYVKADNTLYVANREDVKNKVPELVPYYDEIARIDNKYDALSSELEDAYFDALTEWMDENPDADMDVVYPTSYIIENKPADIDSPKYHEAFNRHKDIMDEWKREYDSVAVKGKEAITNYLKNNGYDSMYLTVDGGSFGRQTDSLIVLDNNQVKSADTVTYDDNGNVIPLSERFNEKNDDIRYSLDTNGRELTKGQQEYFKDSKVRDEKGNLLVVYHGSNNQFNVFEKRKGTRSLGILSNYEVDTRGFFFSPNEEFSSEYGRNVRPFYLNVKKPLLTATDKINWNTLDNNGKEVFNDEERINELYYILEPAIKDILDYRFESSYSIYEDTESNQKHIKRWALKDLWQEFDGDVYSNMSLPWEVIDNDNFDECVSRMEELGYDGFMVSEGDGKPDSWFALNPNQVKSVTNENPTSDSDIRYSLSDSNGRELTKAQQEFFKDSKVRDDNGNLKVMYHGSENAGFHVFDGDYSKDGISHFFTDNNTVAKGYSGTNETYVARTFKTAEEVNDFLNEIGEADRFEVREENGEFVLYDDGDAEATSDTATDIYKEFLDYTGLGWGSANYEVYLDIKNPFVIDADSNNWNEIPIPKELQEGMQSFKEEDGDYATTREFSRYAYENGYDGVIFKNVYDIAIYASSKEYQTSTVAVVFDSNQIKSVANENPTSDPDIRFSISEGDIAPVNTDVTKGRDLSDALERTDEVESQLAKRSKKYKALAEKRDSLGKLTETEFNSYYHAHKFLRGETEEEILEKVESIKKDGFKSQSSVNIASANNDNSNIIRVGYRPFEGETVLLIPDHWIKKNENYILNGYKPLPYEAVKIEYNSQPYYEAYAKAYNDYFGIEEEDYIVNKYRDYGYDELVKMRSDLIAEMTANGTLTDSTNKTREKVNEIQRHINRYFNKNGVKYSLSDDNDIAPVKPNSDAEFFRQTTKDNINQQTEQNIKAYEQESKPKPPIFKEVSTTKKSRRGLGSAWDTFQSQFVNRNRQQDKLAKQTGNREIKFKGDRVNNIAGEIGGDIFTAQTDNYGNRIGKSLHSHFEPILAKGNGVYFNDYLMHLSNIERHAQGKGSEVSADTSKAYVEAYESRFPEFKKAADGVHTYNVNQLNNAVENGLYSREFIDYLTSMYGKYVPFYSAEIETPNIDTSPDEIRSGRPIKRAIGGAGSTLQSVEQAMIKQTYSYMNAIAKNDLYKEIVNEYGGGSKSIDTREGDTIKLEDFLYEDETGKYLTAFFKGEARSVQIPEELFKELKRDLDTQIREIEDKYGVITKPLQKISQLRGKLLTTYNPGFIVTNPIKDVMDAMLNSKHTMRYLKNIASAPFDKHKGKNVGEYAEDFKRLTGQDINTVTNTDSLSRSAKRLYNKYQDASTWNRFITSYGMNATQLEYADEVDINIKKSAKKAKNKGFLNKLSNANNFMEVMFRYPEFKATLEKGRSFTEALYNAREVTTNFGRGGTISKAINRNGATFFNTSVQGMDKFFRNFSGEDGAKGFMSTVSKAVIFGMAPALLNHLLLGGEDEEDYEALPDYVKDNYYLFRKSEGEFIRIPKGRMISVLGSAARRTLEGFEQPDNPYVGFLDNAKSQIGASNPLKENIIAPITQAIKNEAWYGDDIVPYRLQNLPANEQYDATTDSFSVWLGEKLNMSPYKINYVIDQYSGGIGDALLPMMTPEATSGAEGAGLLLAPIKDKFVVNSTDDNKYIGELFDLSDSLKVKTNSSDATLDDVLNYEYISDIASEMGELYALKREIQADDTLSKSEKYAEVQKVQELINDIASEGVRNYKYGDSLDIAYEQHPEAMISLVYDNYKTYTTYKYAMWDIKADKDKNGNSIWGSRKDKVIDYINSTDLDYGERLILFKQEYPADDTHNEDIIDYLNSRDDLYYEDIVAILESLDFKVRSDGTIEW